MKRLLFLVTLAAFSPLACQSPGESSSWETLAEGLQVRSFNVKSGEAGDRARIVVLRIDPSQWDLELRARSEHGGANDKSAKQWSFATAEDGAIVAATNAGMFNTDYTAHIGYMKSGEHINNPQILRNQYLSAALFGPQVRGIPDFRIVDLDEVDLDSLKDLYQYVIQNLRLIKYPGENRWEEQSREWSESALAEDSAGNALFIFSRQPFSMFRFNETILKLPLNIVRAQHLEGGPEAQMFYKVGERHEEFIGGFESDLGKYSNHSAWPIPNAIVVKQKQARAIPAR